MTCRGHRGGKLAGGVFCSVHCGRMVRIAFGAWPYAHQTCMSARAVYEAHEFSGEPSLLITAWRGSRAQEECNRRFDAPGRSCTRCGSSLPATFFHRGQAHCISCCRAYSKQYKEAIVPAPPLLKQCSRCHRTLSATCFHKSFGHHTGLAAHCRECAKQVNLEHQQSMRQVPLPAAMRAADSRCTSCQLVKPRSDFPNAQRVQAELNRGAKPVQQNKIGRIAPERLLQTAMQNLCLRGNADRHRQVCRCLSELRQGSFGGLLLSC